MSNIKTASLDELRAMKERGDLLPLKDTAPEIDMPDGFWDDAEVVSRPTKDEVDAMADELDAEVFARCGVKAKEATVLRAQSDRIAELEVALKEAANQLEQIGETCWDKIDRDATKAACDEASAMASDALVAITALIPSNPTPEHFHLPPCIHLTAEMAKNCRTCNPTPEPTAAMFGMGGDNDDFDT
tara:strand:- start:7535 stop:8095 length:561 start_codon:yes stop_codon:yes gene_type:complete